MTRNWTSSVRGGRNIAVENSFRIQYDNFSNQQGTVGLFSLGSNNITQSAVTQINSTFLNIDVSAAVDSSGVVIAPFFQFQVSQTYLGVNPLYYGQNLIVARSALLPIGFNFLNVASQPYTNRIYTIPPSGVYSFVNVPTTNGQFTDLNGNFCKQWYIEVKDLAASIYNFVYPNVSLNLLTGVTVSGTIFEQKNVTISQSSLDVNNPFLQTSTQTPVPVSAIQQSSNGSTIGVLCLDIYSQNKEQVIQSIDYQYRDSNGNLNSFSADPIINPYQPQVGSISCLDLEMMQINTETTISYKVLPNSSALLTYNYVRFTIWDYYEFDRVFAQQLRDNYFLQKKLLNKNRISLLQIE